MVMAVSLAEPSTQEMPKEVFAKGMSELEKAHRCTLEPRSLILPWWA